ncbi:hypothetical protein [Knoellia koreensis]|uniref:Uncharacterized protein n=1 Tax=Knoellia koreensis TaxID=2730921 RepID=A0A849H9J9_9MICO|nr:hypothetical protein [Knoellia sp. DB2414S]NNM46550.1 hypothetical protein [Knoellia sp. DB2414S]
MEFKHLQVTESSRGGTPEPQLVDYLNHGAVVFAGRMRKPDPYDASVGDVVGVGMMTDGEWLWAFADAYFVQRYNFEVPQAFLERVAANGGVVPEVSQETLLAAMASMQPAESVEHGVLGSDE